MIPESFLLIRELDVCKTMNKWERRITLRYVDVETFMAIVSQRSITKAANSLFVAQSTVSQRLSKLEREFGGRLFVRKPGIDGVELTTKGDRFLPIAERLLSIWREADNVVSDYTHVPLMIGSIESLATVTFNPLFDNILNSGESMQFRLITGSSDYLHNLVDQKKIDAAFLTREVKNPHLICTPIFQEKMVLLSKKGIIHTKQPVDISTLNIGEEVFFSWSPEFKTWHEKYWGAGERPSVYVDLTSLYLYFVSERYCWTICPESMVRYLWDHSRIDSLNIECHECKDPPPKRTVYLLSHSFPMEERDRGLKLFHRELNYFLNGLEGNVLNSEEF